MLVESLKQPIDSASRIDPECPYFGTCGGCRLQDYPYRYQLALKADRVSCALRPFGLSQPIDLVRLEDPWRYRNKAEFSFGWRNGQVQLGFHERGSFSKIVDIEDCLLLPKTCSKIVATLRGLVQESGVAIYSPRRHTGIWRYVLLRVSQLTGKLQLSLITASVDPEPVQIIARALKRRYPELSGVYWGVTDRFADIATPERLELLEGEAYLEEQVGPFSLQVHPQNFLQVSSVQADRLYQYVRDGLRMPGTKIAWDLYCGLGLIGMYLSQDVGQVYGIDIESSHFEVTRQNVERNGITNITFHQGSAEDVLKNRRFWLQQAQPDVVVADPPRSGLHLQVISTLLAARPKRIAYVSCSLKALVRDLEVLLSSYPKYTLKEAKAFDMFPQTNHVEVCTILERAA